MPLATIVFAALALVAACDGCGERVKVGEVASIVVYPSTVGFDEVPIGGEQDVGVVVENLGGATLEISTFRWRGASSEFTPIGLRGLTVPPRSTGEFTLRYRPVDPAADSAVLTLVSNAVEGDYDVRVTTAGQGSRIGATPNPVEVSADRLREPIETRVRVFNAGARPLSIDAMGLETGLPHWSLVDLPSPLPQELAPAGSFEFGVVFSPENGGVHRERVLIGCDADNCEAGRYFVDLLGTATTPALELSPPDVGFGRVGIGETVEATVTATNVGEGELVISSLTLAPNPADTDGEIRLVSVGGLPWAGGAEYRLAPGDVVPIVVAYAPTDNADDVDTLVARSNDPDLPIQTVRLAGRAAAPRLEVFPLSVGFGTIARELAPVYRDVTIRNAGSDALELAPLQLRDATGAFRLENLAAMPSSLAPDEAFDLRVAFTPPLESARPEDTFFGTLFVLPTNDPYTAEQIVQLEGSRAERPVCEVQVFPAVVNYGVVPRGTRVERTATLENVGSGPCEVLTAGLEASLLGLFSNHFAYLGAAPALPLTLGPGDSVEFTTSYFPRTLTPLSETFGDQGSVAVRVSDPFADPAERDVRCGFSGTLGSTRLCGFNLQGRSAIAQLAVIPSAIDFSLVTVGCNSQQAPVRVYNTGTADVQVTGVRLEDCSAEVRLDGVPALPRTMRAGESFEVQVRYAPDAVGADRCRLVVEGTTEGGGSIVVPMAGEGVSYARTTDRFEQVSGRAVDVLFVIDNSGSMGEEQRNVARNFSAFIGAARTWSSDFQIGVVTTQIDGAVRNPSGGSREPGHLLGEPRILTPRTPSYESVFNTTVGVGTSGSSTEAGFEAARLALSDPVITDLASPCDSACVSPYACVTPPGRAAGCGGFNRGFLRDEASLEIVFVSDEEEQSRASVTFFLDFFRSLKGAFNDGLFRASAIVGPRGGCTSTDGEAAAGDRYMELATATGGAVESICTREFSRVLGEIGNRAFGLRRQFGLSRSADPTTVQVFALSGCAPGAGRTPVTAGWTFDRASNGVVWAVGQEPAAGSCFEVEYEAACY